MPEMIKITEGQLILEAIFLKIWLALWEIWSQEKLHLRLTDLFVHQNKG